MADLKDRESLEAALARKLGKANRQALDIILSALGDPPDLTKLTEDRWIEIRQLFEAATIAELEKVFIAAVEGAAAEVGVGVDWQLANTRASEWATNYGFELVRDMTQNRRRFLQQSIADFNRTGMTLGDLKERLSREFGVVRAQSIAVSETTRAAVEGERAYTNSLRQRGVQLETQVETNADERVCPLCSPKQGQDPERVGYPPYHPGCRCWTTSKAIPLQVAS